MINRTAIERIHVFLQSQSSRTTAGLLDGPWGSGKTHILRIIEESYRKEDALKRCAYVTCYGADSITDIDGQLFASAHPLIAKANIPVIARLISGLPYASGFREVSVADLVEHSKFELIIFDDIERSLIPSAVLLGYINQFVEHSDCKVLCACNVGRLKDETGFHNFREKTFGRTFHLGPVGAADILEVCNQHTVRHGALVPEEVFRELSELYSKLKRPNIRAFRHALEAATEWLDRERPHWIDDTTAVGAWTRYVTAIFLITRSDENARSMIQKELDNPWARILSARENNSDETPFPIADDLAALGITFHSSLTSAALGLEKFGHAEPGLVSNALLELGYIRNSETTEPAWQTAGQYFNRPTEAVNLAIEYGIEKLQSCEPMLWGELKHWIATITALEERGLGRIHIDDVFQLGEQYIDRFCTKPEELEFPWDISDESNLGYSYHRIRDQQLAERFSNLHEYAVRRFVGAELMRVRSVLDDVSTAVEVVAEFERSVVYQYARGSQFFLDIRADEVARKLLAADTLLLHQYLRMVNRLAVSDFNSYAAKEDGQFANELRDELLKLVETVDSNLRRLQIASVAQSVGDRTSPDR